MQISFKTLIGWCAILLFNLTSYAQYPQKTTSDIVSDPELAKAEAFPDSVYGYGIDISHYNPEPDWNTLDVDFVIMKATEGTSYVDPTFSSRRANCRKAGIPVGAYHYFLGNTDGKTEFNNFLRTVGMEIDLRPAIDLERIPKGVAKKDFQRNLETFINAIYDTYGVMPILYSKDKFYREIVLDVIHDEWNEMGLDIWIGDMDREYGSFQYRPAIHQKQIKRIKGIKGDVDFNELHTPLQKLLLP